MNESKTISLFIPCLVDQILPEIGFAMADVLRKLHYDVTYDARQTCCGQPAFNAGHRTEAMSVAKQFLATFSNADCIVSPSGSCSAMVRNYYPVLFAGDEKMMAQVHSVQERTFEFSEFISAENKVERIVGHADVSLSIHNSCHSMRELGIDEQIADILARIEGVKLFVPQVEHTCCGFGGLFSYKMPDIASAMAKSRLEAFTGADLDVLIVNDPGCIQHLRAEAPSAGFKGEILHLVEFLQKAMD